MTAPYGNLFAAAVENYRKTGSINPATLEKVIQVVANTSQSSREIAQNFQTMIETEPFTEVNTADVDA